MHVTGQCSQDKPTFSETVGTQCRFQNVLSVYAGQTPWKVYIYIPAYVTPMIVFALLVTYILCCADEHNKLLISKRIAGIL